MNLEGVDIFHAQAIRGATKIPAELRYGIEVRLLRRRRQIADRYVLDHTAAKRTDLISVIGKPPVRRVGLRKPSILSDQTGADQARPLPAAKAASFNPKSIQAKLIPL
jgi:hypothetical protein